MIRWSEEKDCYRVAISHPLQAGCLLLVGAASLLVSALFLIIGMREALFNPPFWLTCTVFLAFGVGAIWTAAGYHRQTAWIEIAVRGGRARWGGRSCDPVDDFVEVSHFHQCLRGFPVRVEAHLCDGRTLRVFGPWSMFSVARADKLVAQLNEFLCTGP